MPAHFWSQLAKPIIGLSPMDGITDHPFRHITKKYGQPGVIYTEFTSVEGVCHGADRLLQDFLFDETQRPIVGQIYGTTPDFFRQTAIVLCDLGFDGVDINMGCPAKNVAHSGAGAALIKTPDLAQEIVRAVQQGIREWNNGATAADCPNITQKISVIVAQRKAQLPLSYQQPREIPVSIKTRVGFNEKIVEQWLPTLLETQPAAIAIHGRTLKQQYSGLADWDQIGQATTLAKGSGTLILGNGDVSSLADAQHRITTYGVDGVLIGRATMGNPFIFKDYTPTVQELASLAVEHSQLYEQTFSQDERYFFLPMRKHLGWYLRGMARASEIRMAVFKANTSMEVAQVLTSFGLLDPQDETPASDIINPLVA